MPTTEQTAMQPMPAMERRSSGALLPLLAAGLLLSLLYIPPVDLFYDDKAIFRYIGRVIVHGGVPYRDVFDHKPPLIYFFNIAGPWGLWFVDTALVLLATGLFYRLCRRYKLSLPWLLPLLFNLLIRNYLVCMGIGMTRAYTAIFLLLFFCVLMSRSAYRYFWMGLLTAATFFMQQDQVLPLLPFIIYAAAGAFYARNGRDLLIAAAGFATLCLPILFFFALHHALDFFWEDAFRFNFSWYTGRVPLPEHFRSIRAALETTGTLMPFILSVTLGVAALLLARKSTLGDAALLLPQKNKPLVLTALLTVCLSFIADYLSGHSFHYYLLPLSASLPILVFTVYNGSNAPFLQDRNNRLLYGFLLCCLPLYNAVQHAAHLSTNNADLVTKTPEFRWLSRQPLERYDLYIFGNSNWAYAYDQLQTLSPSVWIYHYFWEWYPRWDADHRLLDSIQDRLLEHRTRYIVDYSDELHFQDPSARSEWNAFLEKYYRPISLPDATGQHLWAFNSPATGARQQEAAPQHSAPPQQPLHQQEIAR